MKFFIKCILTLIVIGLLFAFPFLLLFIPAIPAYYLVKGINKRCNEIDDDTALGMAAHQLLQKHKKD